LSIFKKQLKRILAVVSHGISLPLLIQLSGQKLFLPFYHTVSDRPLPHISNLYPLRTVKQFREDLDYLLRYYQPLGLEELLHLAQNGIQPKKPAFFISFDDGLSEVYDVIAPILSEKGIPAAFFINPAFVDNKDLFYRYKASLLIEQIKLHPPGKAEEDQIHALFKEQDLQITSLPEAILHVGYTQRSILDELAKLLEIDFREYLNKEKPYMDRRQLGALLQSGFTIGAHSWDHPLYEELSIEDQLQQTGRSMDFLQSNFPQKYRAFAFPFTDHGVSTAFFKRVYMLGNPLLDLSFGTAGLKKDSFPLHLQRFPMEGSLRPAEELIKTEYLYYLMKMLAGRNTIKRS
jgi:peptidoglycan/xylan/chitin deacetylase (PgdA/CDA1 family)